MPKAETPTTFALTMAARARGMAVVAVHDVDDLEASGGYVYGGPRFAQFVAERLDLALIEPVDTWLPSLPRAFTQRSVQLIRAEDLRHVGGAVFVKPPREKGLEARVYAAGDLPESGDFSRDELLLISDPVRWQQEYRLFVLDQRVLTGSRYQSYGRPDFAALDSDPDASAVRAFAEELLGQVGDSLPSAVVIDVGWIGSGDDDRRLAVVEANMAWFSHRYECDPDHVLDVVMRAAGPRTDLLDRDAPYVRSPS